MWVQGVPAVNSSVCVSSSSAHPAKFWTHCKDRRKSNGRAERRYLEDKGGLLPEHSLCITRNQLMRTQIGPRRPDAPALLEGTQDAQRPPDAPMPRAAASYLASDYWSSARPEGAASPWAHARRLPASPLALLSSETGCSRRRKKEQRREPPPPPPLAGKRLTRLGRGSPGHPKHAAPEQPGRLEGRPFPSPPPPPPSLLCFARHPWRRGALLRPSLSTRGAPPRSLPALKLDGVTLPKYAQERLLLSSPTLVHSSRRVSNNHIPMAPI
ncbi:Hypothetical predicted protein [Podarcis lilfordi]|uniref:Uncharacterized protein n=1 Tax=Podarcis lilfordi TaxID=74358 RepID=A0AA35KXU5_9SAUR|nr:Hypothetical predicted protein [Podarcis lilfordi]